MSPSRVIIDRDLKLKTNLDLIKNSKKIPTYIITNSKKKNKISFLKSKKIKIINMYEKNKFFSYKDILMELKRRGFNRILCEAGFKTSKSLLDNKLVHNLYVFMSKKKLGKNGIKSFKSQLRHLKAYKKVFYNINLYGDKLYKLEIK